MPSERRGTVTEDIAGYIRRMQGSVEWKGDTRGTIRAAIAKVRYPCVRTNNHRPIATRPPGRQKT